MNSATVITDYFGSQVHCSYTTPPPLINLLPVLFYKSFISLIQRLLGLKDKILITKVCCYSKETNSMQTFYRLPVLWYCPRNITFPNIISIEIALFPITWNSFLCSFFVIQLSEVKQQAFSVNWPPWKGLTNESWNMHIMKSSELPNLNSPRVCFFSQGSKNRESTISPCA